MDFTKKLFILEWIQTGLKNGYLIGPFKKNDPFVSDIVTSPIGAVFSNKLRTIVHLSAPVNGRSVNSSLSEDMRTVTYIKLREIVNLFYNKIN